MKKLLLIALLIVGCEGVYTPEEKVTCSIEATGCDSVDDYYRQSEDGGYYLCEVKVINTGEDTLCSVSSTITFQVSDSSSTSPWYDQEHSSGFGSSNLMFAPYDTMTFTIFLDVFFYMDSVWWDIHRDEVFNGTAVIEDVGMTQYKISTEFSCEGCPMFGN